MSSLKKSSASTNNIYSPCDASNPMFLAPPAPRFELSITLTFGNLFSYSFNIFNVLSVEPSSTKIISISLNVCLKILFTH